MDTLADFLLIPWLVGNLIAGVAVMVALFYGLIFWNKR